MLVYCTYCTYSHMSIYICVCRMSDVYIYTSDIVSIHSHIHYIYIYM